jgi:divalent metal cation (Fe/Co/Zn/Cd) transporter
MSTIALSQERRGAAAPRALRYAQATIAYSVIEGVIAVTAGFVAGSVALVGFGFDSWIEVTAATVVLIRLRAEIRGETVDELKERRALRVVAVTFFALAVYVTVEGVRDLVRGAVPEVSPAGIALTASSIVVMPLLARAKRRVGEQMGSRLVLADAAETKLCAWLSVSTFAGLAGYAVAGWTWLDPIAGFVIAVFALMEGREAWQGELACEGELTAGSDCAVKGCTPGRPPC